MTPPESQCGCSLPAGCWGDTGWHFVICDEFMVQEKIRSAELLEGEAQSRGRDRRALFFRDEAAFWRTNGKLYLGLKFALEKCPAYQAGMREGEARKKAGVAAQGQPRYE